jgi:hypothetical protein
MPSRTLIASSVQFAIALVGKPDFSARIRRAVACTLLAMYCIPRPARASTLDSRYLRRSPVSLRQADRVLQKALHSLDPAVYVGCSPLTKLGPVSGQVRQVARGKALTSSVGCRQPNTNIFRVSPKRMPVSRWCPCLKEQPAWRVPVAGP